MRLKIALIVLSALGAGSVCAQETQPTDLTRYEIFQEGDNTRTLSELQTMEDDYRELLSTGDCDAAIPKIVEFHEAANLVSNLIRRGNEPYYDARREAQDVIARDRTLLNELISAERAFNRLIERRNVAWVEEAKCLLAIGEQQQAITRLYRALDYISTDERGLWEEARRLLWAEVGLDVDSE